MADKAGLQLIGWMMASVTAGVFLIAALLIARSAGLPLDDQPAARQAQHIAVVDRT
jgi:hypothetical protein